MHNGHIDSVYISGLGALGCLYAAKLYNLNPALVKIIADKKRISTFQQSGLTVNNKPYNFNFISPGDEHSCPDLIIIAVKNAQLLQAINDVKGFIGEDTIVISLLNGISSEEIIGETIGAKHLLYAYGVGMDAIKIGNRANYTNSGKVVFGEKHNERFTERVKAVKDLFERAHIPYQVPVNMEKALWSKFMMNTGINQASAVLKAPYGVFQQNEDARQLVLLAAEEVIKISEHAGINLTHADVDEFFRIIDTLDPEGKTSMLQDIEAGRKTEVELFAGTVIELGKKYNIATPVNETLFRIISVIEKNNDSIS